jgi:predicted  nucleic acid-binding Zn-ribbon protein
MCHCCNDAREAPQHHRFFAEGCLHCAARRIQYLQRTLRLAPSVTRDRCRAALADAVANGLPELEIRRMAKLPEWQVAELVAVPEVKKTKRVR